MSKVYKLPYTGNEIKEKIGQVDKNTTAIGQLSEQIGDLQGEKIPDYWEEHLVEKIETIKALHRQYGRDCFSFVHIADPHYPSNLGKRSPLLAERIMEETQIKFTVVDGDMQTRGCHQTKELLLAENEAILEMFKPILKKTLFQKGNHDGAYGLLDRDGGGYDNTGKEPAERESYVHNLTPQEFHEYCYRKVGMVGDIHFDKTGTAYYIDDTANNVRFIGLNTQCNDYELQEDGTQKYPTMWLMRYTQPQFDFLINKALVGLEEDTRIVVFGHVPPTQELGDGDLMIGLLKAFKDKTTYSGTYNGTADGLTYTNLAEPLPDNTTDTSKWVNGYRFSSSGAPSAQAGTSISNHISAKGRDVIRIAGVTLRENTDRIAVHCKGCDENAYTRGYFNAGVVAGSETPVVYNGLENGVYTFTLSNWSDNEIDSFRFAMPTPTDPSKVIITVNEEIVEGAVSGYDYVEVDCDFTNSKGKLVGYFHGHNHIDSVNSANGFNIIGTRCDGKEENDATLKAERIAGTVTEQSFDVFTVTPTKIYATKIGAGSDREINLV